MLFLCCLPFSLKFTFTPKIYTFGCKIFDLGKSKGFLFLHLLETQGSLLPTAALALGPTFPLAPSTSHCCVPAWGIRSLGAACARHKRRPSSITRLVGSSVIRVGQAAPGHTCRPTQMPYLEWLFRHCKRMTVLLDQFHIVFIQIDKFE